MLHTRRLVESSPTTLQGRLRPLPSAAHPLPLTLKSPTVLSVVLRCLQPPVLSDKIPTPFPRNGSVTLESQSARRKGDAPGLLTWRSHPELPLLSAPLDRCSLGTIFIAPLLPDQKIHSCFPTCYVKPHAPETSAGRQNCLHRRKQPEPAVSKRAATGHVWRLSTRTGGAGFISF